MTENPEFERQEDVVFVPLGGTGEIGMNMNLYGYGLPGNRDWIMVDAGVMFGDEESRVLMSFFQIHVLSNSIRNA